MAKLYKSFSAKPKLALNQKTGELLDLSEVKKSLSQNVKMVTDLAQWQLNSDHNLTEDLDSLQSSPNCPPQAWMKGERLNFCFDREIISEWKAGKSRFERLVYDRIVRETLSYKERLNAFEGLSNKYISKGWKRTLNPNRALNISPKMSLSSADRQYSKILNSPYEDGEILLYMIVDGQWVTLIFDFDSERFSDSNKICYPDITLDPNGNPVFHFAVEYEYNKSLISEDYIIGVDLGVIQSATVSVVNMKTGLPAKTTTLSKRVHSLQNSIKASDKQKNYLMAKGRKEEAAEHRKSSKRKKRELAILVAQEIASLSVDFGNALVCFEKLDWIENTMSAGRWNRGEVVKWSQHFIGLNGGLSYKVNAANTSQKCYKCEKNIAHVGNRLVKCSDCDFIVDRDVNASINIAKNGIIVGEKSCRTRKKRKDSIKNVVKRSPDTINSLKFPGRDRTKVGPTPKRVRNKSSKREVNSSFTRPGTSNDDSRVVSDGMSLKKSRHVRTLKKRLIFSSRSMVGITNSYNVSQE